MVLSRIQLDTARRSTMRALASPNLLHGAVEGAFPGPRVRNLWRIDTLGDKTWLLLLSREKPDLSKAAAQYGLAENAWESKPYEPLLNRNEAGGVWQFRLTANPTVSKSRTGDARSRVLGHITEDYQKQWLMSRAEKHGFSLRDEQFRVTESRWLRFWKGTDGGRLVTLLSVSYEGLLTVTDPNLFRQTLCEGIGRGKAYGLGLLTVAGKRSGV